MNSQIKAIRWDIKNLVRLLSVLLSFVCFVCLVFLENKPNYRAILLLPLTMTIITACFPFRKKIKSLPFFIIYALYVLRYTVFPLILCVCGYQTTINKQLWESCFNEACILMSIEAIFVFICLYFILSIKSRWNNQSQSDKYRFNPSSRFLRGNTGLTVLAVTCGVYVLFIGLLFPGLIIAYWDIPFVSPEDGLRFQQLYNYQSQIPSLLYTLYQIASELLRYSIIIIFLTKIRYLKKNDKFKLFAMLFVTVAGAVIQSFERINSVIVFVIGIYYIITSISLKTQKSLLYLIGLIVIVAIGFYGFKVADIDGQRRLCDIVNDYFCGPITTAQVIFMKKNIGAYPLQIINDFLGSVPILTKFVDVVTLTKHYQQYFNIQGNFVSLVGSGYYYFGYLGCWIPAAIVMLCVKFLDNLSKKTKSVAMSLMFTLCAVNCAIAVGMYELTIFVSAWFHIYIWCILAGLLDNRKSVKYRINNQLRLETRFG